MPNLSWMEMLVVGIVALIVIGPKDLPGMFRQVGQFVGKAKGMAREFSSAMNAAADEAGVKEINKTIKAAANPQKFGVDKIREATKMETPSEAKPESETDKLRAKMTDERKATAKKMSDAMAKKAEDRIAAEKEAAAKAEKAEAARLKRNAAARERRAAAKAAKEAAAPDAKDAT